MKRYRYKIVVFALLCVSLGFVSCDDWLDVRPKSEIKAEDLFSTESGFRQALFGIYTGMSASEIYGGNLTMSFLDVLAQNYVIQTDSEPFYYEKSYEYDNINVERRINSVWAKMYSQIVNCNNLLENLEGQEDLFVDDNYKILLAETKALRAFLHFDLLRMFGPSLASGGGSTLAIPFVDKVQNTPFPQLTVNKMLEKIVQELTQAKELIKEIDPIGPNNDTYFDSEDEFHIGKNIYMGDDGFLLFRKSRMNYYAITGMLARVYLYQDDKAKALEAAKEVLESGRFKWIDVYSKIIGNKSPDIIFYDEIIFNLYNDNLDVKSDNYFKRTAYDRLYITDVRREKYFTVELGGDSDYRHRYQFDSKGEAEEYVSKYDFLKYDTKYIPMLRLSEMAYIAAECEPNQVKALEYLNTVRRNRGYAEDNPISIEADLEKEIYNEYRREFIAEGQLFYYMKRKNIINIDYSDVDGSEAVYVLPLPDSEIDLGNIK